MSILLGLYEESDPYEKCEEEDLLVFGYACKLYRDDSKALLEDSGQLLIPWMGDTSLMIDRYDIRNRLEDKSQFGLKPSLPHKMSEEEEELEELLDRERYLALETDAREEEFREEEEKKRLFEELDGSYNAVPFSYGPPVIKEHHTSVISGPVLPEHPPTSSVDFGEEDLFTPPVGLSVPEGIKVPATNKLHSIIEKTALFVSRQGTQMEIIIKTKQKFNPFFSFLDFGDALNPYYRYLLQVVSSGSYTPKSQEQQQRSENITKPEIHVQEEPEVNGHESQNGQPDKEEQNDKEEKENMLDEDESDAEGSDSDDSYELHPLLRASVTPRSSKPATPTPVLVPVTEADCTEEVRTGNTSAFYAKRLAINSAPSLDSGTPTSRDQSAGQGTPNVTSQYMQQQPYGSYPMGYSIHEHHPVHSPHYYHGKAYYDAYGYHQMHYAQNLEAYYHALRDQHIHHSSSGPTPPPPDLQPIVDKTAQYVARNEDGFERTVLEKHCDDPRFRFLNPWDQYHGYYQMKKQEHREMLAQVEADKENALKSIPNIQRLSETGSISFKLEAKSSKLSATKVDLTAEEEGEGEEREEEEERPPPAKRPHTEGEDEEEDDEDKMDIKVQEFLSRVKAMLGTDQ